MSDHRPMSGQFPMRPGSVFPRAVEAQPEEPTKHTYRVELIDGAFDEINGTFFTIDQEGYLRIREQRPDALYDIAVFRPGYWQACVEMPVKEGQTDAHTPDFLKP